MPLLCRLLSLTPQQDIYLLLDPVFVVWLVCLSVSSVPVHTFQVLSFYWNGSTNSNQDFAFVFFFKSYLHKTAQIRQVVNKVKQLTNVISDRGAVWIHPLQMLFVHFTNT